MKKSILAIAVAATMAAPAAMAAPTVYGNVHLTVLDLDSADNLVMTSNTSSIGVKGSEDLGDGLKAIYKVEFQLDAASGSATGDALTNRDTFVGLKGGMGTVKFGLMSSNYKQMGGKMDSLYRTPAEGRGLMHTQSNLHNGRAINRGRSTNTVQYTSPKMGGISLVANTTFAGVDEETNGVGIRWSNKSLSVYADWIDTQVSVLKPVAGDAETESAMKIGGKYSTKDFHIAAQYEDAEDVTGFNYIHLNAGFNINKNNSIQATIGTAEANFGGPLDSDFDTESFTVAYVHSLSKQTMVYVAYVDVSDDVTPAHTAGYNAEVPELAAVDFFDSREDSAFAIGIRKKF